MLNLETLFSQGIAFQFRHLLGQLPQCAIQFYILVNTLILTSLVETSRGRRFSGVRGCLADKPPLITFSCTLLNVRHTQHVFCEFLAGKIPTAALRGLEGKETGSFRNDIAFVTDWISGTKSLRGNHHIPHRKSARSTTCAIWQGRN